jgi:hypothetical protein
MTIEPVRRTVRLDCTPDRAFELFTSAIGRWWPLATHSLGGERAVDVRFEPFEGGRLFEIDTDGTEAAWGTVQRWEPGRALAFSWHVGRSPELATTVAVTFAATDDGRTAVDLEHRDWDVLGAEAEAVRAGYETGWIGVLDLYVAHGTAAAA